MTEDSLFIGFVSAVWGLLWALYAFVPMFSMPGSALVWGSGAIVFFVLFVLSAASDLKTTLTTDSR